MRSICHLLFWVIFGDQPILLFRYEGVCICHLFTRASKLSLLFFFFFCEASWISLDVLDNVSVFLRASVPSLDRYQIRSVSSGGMTGNEKRERRGMMWDKRPWAKRHWRCNSWRDAFKPPGHRGYCCLIVTPRSLQYCPFFSQTDTSSLLRRSAELYGASMFSMFYFQKTQLGFVQD